MVLGEYGMMSPHVNIADTVINYVSDSKFRFGIVVRPSPVSTTGSAQHCAILRALEVFVDVNVKGDPGQAFLLWKIKAPLLGIIRENFNICKKNHLWKFLLGIDILKPFGESGSILVSGGARSLKTWSPTTPDVDNTTPTKNEIRSIFYRQG